MKIKFQVWSETQQRWRTAYVYFMTDALNNAALFREHGFKVRYSVV